MADKRILVCDDEERERRTLARIVRQAGYEVIEASNGVELLRKVRDEHPMLVLSDVRMPGMDGLTTLRQIRHEGHAIPVVLVTGLADQDSVAREAHRLGAVGVLGKPCDSRQVKTLIERVLRDEEAKETIGGGRVTRSLHSILGEPQGLDEIIARIRSAALEGARSLLLFGEPGSGRRTLARAYHAAASDAAGRFEEVEGTLRPIDSLRSALFGHEPGASPESESEGRPRTGHRGALEVARGGVAFIDTAQRLPRAIQTELAAAIATGRFRRMGGTRWNRLEARLVLSAQALGSTVPGLSHELVDALDGHILRVPPLRERPQDIGPLAERLVAQHAHRHGQTAPKVSPAALELLMRQEWPGNVQELERALSLAVQRCAGSPTLEPEHLPDALRGEATPSGISQGDAAVRELPLPATGLALADVERGWIRQALQRSAGDVARAAGLLGLTPEGLAELRERLGR